MQQKSHGVRNPLYRLPACTWMEQSLKASSIARQEDIRQVYKG